MQKWTETITCYHSTANGGKHDEQWTEKIQRRTKLWTMDHSLRMRNGFRDFRVLGDQITFIPSIVSKAKTIQFYQASKSKKFSNQKNGAVLILPSLKSKNGAILLFPSFQIKYVVVLVTPYE